MARSPAYWLTVGALFVDAGLQLGKRAAPGALGSRWFQHGGTIACVALLAIALPLALQRALNGKLRTTHALMGAFIVVWYAAKLALFVSGAAGMATVASDAAGAARPWSDRLGASAWTASTPVARANAAHSAYVLSGLRIGYRDESGAARVFAPSAVQASRRQESDRAEEEIPAVFAKLAWLGDQFVWLSCVYVAGLALMLVGVSIVAVRSRARASGLPWLALAGLFSWVLLAFFFVVATSSRAFAGDTAPGTDPAVARAGRNAWTAADPQARALAAGDAYDATGLRIGYRGADGATRVFEPTAEQVARREMTASLQEQMRTVNARLGEASARYFRFCYVALAAVTALLLATCLLAHRRGLRGRSAPAR